MKFVNSKKQTRILVIVGLALFVLGLIVSLRSVFMGSTSAAPYIFSAMFIIGLAVLTACAEIAFSYTVLSEDGVAYKSLFKRRFFAWDKIKFFGSFDLSGVRFTGVKGIICSFDFEPDDIQYRHLIDGFSLNPHYYVFPYTKEAESFLAKHLTQREFLGAVFKN